MQKDIIGRDFKSSTYMVHDGDLVLYQEAGKLLLIETNFLYLSLWNFLIMTIEAVSML